MWGNVFAVLAILAGLGVAALAVRHHLRQQELARDAEASDAARREAETAVFARPPDFPETENEKPLPTWDGEVTEMVPVVESGSRRRTWVPKLSGLLRDRRRLTDDATRVLEPLTGLAGRCEHGEQMLNECKPCEAMQAAARWNKRRVMATDELGEWEPAAHPQAEPEILGDVLAWRKWKTVRPEHVGMGSK